MKFVYRNWEEFCILLDRAGIHSIPACEVTGEMGKYLVLKHDVETNVQSAYNLAKIENKYGHRGSYYVQAYLLERFENVEYLKKMQLLGHEISYHYDVMDSCRGNLKQAIAEFERNRCMFENYGFPIRTVCQHGNPVVERVGYHSNRDFFRSEKVHDCYPDIMDIMVNFKNGVPTEYTYFSDAGRQFKLVYDPIWNDVVNSDEHNISFESLQEIMPYITKEACIVSMHPHRWTASLWKYELKTVAFRVIRFTAKKMMKIPLMKIIMSRYYHLAKKI